MKFLTQFSITVLLFFILVTCLPTFEVGAKPQSGKRVNVGSPGTSRTGANNNRPTPNEVPNRVGNVPRTRSESPLPELINNGGNNQPSRSQSPLQDILHNQPSRSQSPLQDIINNGGNNQPSVQKGSLQYILSNQPSVPIGSLQDILNNQPSRHQSPPQDTLNNQPSRHQSPLQDILHNQPSRSQSPQNTLHNQPSRHQSPLQDILHNQPSRSQSPLQDILHNQPSRSQSPFQDILHNQPSRSQSPLQDIINNGGNNQPWPITRTDGPVTRAMAGQQNLPLSLGLDQEPLRRGAWNRPPIVRLDLGLNTIDLDPVAGVSSIRRARLRNYGNGDMRVEEVKALADSSHIGLGRDGRNFNNGDRVHMRRNLGAQQDDHAGHMIAAGIGGTNERINLVPMHRMLNNNEGLNGGQHLLHRFANTEDYARQWLAGEQPGEIRQVSFRTRAIYPDNQVMRPSQILWKAKLKLNGETVETHRGGMDNNGNPGFVGPPPQ